VQLVDITHKDAVKALKRSRHMILTIKHVGKLPHAKIDDRKLVVSNIRLGSKIMRDFYKLS